MKNNCRNLILIVCILFFRLSVYSQVSIVATGINNTFNILYPANITTISAGMSITFVSNQDITSSPACSLNVNGTGAKQIFKNFNSLLVPGDIKNGQYITVVYDATSGGRWQLLSDSPSLSNITGTGVAGNVAFWNGANSLVNDNNFYWDNTNKRLGIGTLTPNAILDLGGNLANNLQAIFSRGVADPNFYLRAKNGSGSLQSKFGLEYTSGIDNASINFYRGANNFDGYLSFSTQATDRLTISTSGNIGIGSLTPSSRLQVGGSISAPILLTSVSLTLDDTHQTVILTNNNLTIYLPSPISCPGRIYTILSRPLLGSNNFGNFNYVDVDGNNSNNIPNRSSITIQSDGFLWHRVQ